MAHRLQSQSARAYELPSYGSPSAQPVVPMHEPGSPGGGQVGDSPGGGDSSPPPAMRMPGVDERLAIPEAGEEYIDGVRYEVMAGEPAHADPQCQLSYIVRACVASDYVASTELLTRADQKSDFATDVCVRRRGVDRLTGERYLEEISFEVANAQTLPELKKRAKKLVARGVRRVFGIMVKDKKVLEWTRTSGFKERPLRGQIRDRAFKKPLRVGAILDAAAADRLVAEALWEKREPYLVKLVETREAKGRKEGREEGREEGLRRSVEDLCQVIGVDWLDERKARVAAMSFSGLEALREHLMTHRRWP